MKLLKFICVSGLTVGTTMAFASTLGILKLEGSVPGVVNHKGSVTVTNAQVLEGLDVMGKILAEKTVFYKHLSSSGMSTLTQVTLKDAGDFSGILKLKNSQVEGDISIRSDRGSSIENSTVQGSISFVGNEISVIGSTRFKKILVKPSAEHPESPKVYLLSNVLLDGTIQFDGQAGKVILSPGAIFKGVILNGELVKEST